MNEFMIDIETLDTGPRSVVLSIGVVAFDENGVLAGTTIKFRESARQTQINMGRTISQKTLDWWAGQSEAAQAAAFHPNGSSLSMGLTDLAYFIRKWGDKASLVWAKGPQFDLVNIETLIEDTTGEVPWAYNKVRDSRTLCAVLDEDQWLGWAPPDACAEGVDGHYYTPHNPEDDARWQAHQVIFARRAIAAPVKLAAAAVRCGLDKPVFQPLEVRQASVLDLPASPLPPGEAHEHHHDRAVQTEAGHHHRRPGVQR